MNLQEIGVKAGQIGKKHAVEATKELALELLIPALEAAAAASPSKVDDALVAYLGPVLKAELIKLLEGIK